METITRRVIKRNGEEVVFDVQKILNAIRKANNEVEPIHRLNEYQIEAVGKIVMDQICQSNHATAVEDIQDMVERGIMEMRGYEVAQKYVRYRYKRELTRKSNTTDNGILALIEHMNEEVNQENSNKNPVINSTQSRRTRTRTRQSTAYREIIWQEKSAKTYPDVCSFRKRLCRRTKQESSTSMILIILHRKNITVI